MRRVDGAVLITVIMLASTVGLVAFTHLTSSALRLLAAGNGIAMLQIDATLTAAAWHTVHELRAETLTPATNPVPSVEFAGSTVTREMVWGTEPTSGAICSATATFTLAGAVRTVTYDCSVTPVRIVSFQ